MEARLAINALLDQADEAEARGDDAGRGRVPGRGDRPRVRGVRLRDLGRGDHGRCSTRRWPGGSSTRRGRRTPGCTPTARSTSPGSPGGTRSPSPTWCSAAARRPRSGSARTARSTSGRPARSIPPRCRSSAEASVLPRSTVVLLDLDDPAARPGAAAGGREGRGHGPAPVQPGRRCSRTPATPCGPRPGTRRPSSAASSTRRAIAWHRRRCSTALDGPAPAGVDPATWTALRQDRDDTVEAVRARTLWHPSELVAFTAFTTQDTTAEMAALADAVAALPQPEVASRQPATVALPGRGHLPEHGPGGTAGVAGRARDRS